jgi:hypothetical protein
MEARAGVYLDFLAGEWNSRLKACGQPSACADEAARETWRKVVAKTIGCTPARRALDTRPKFDNNLI